MSLFLLSPSSRRAWIEIVSPAHMDRGDGSPSSRRAWIEIESDLLFLEPGRQVALLAEGVDRNHIHDEVVVDCPAVALLAEGVDRNTVKTIADWTSAGRPPRGGRG